MHKHLHVLEDDGLIAHQKHLSDEIVKLKLFSDLSNSAEGRFILDWIDGRKKDLHSFYSSIPAHDDRARIALSAVQAAEAELNALKERITNADEYKKVLEQQLEHIVKLLATRRGVSHSISTKFISNLTRSKDA